MDLLQFCTKTGIPDEAILQLQEMNIPETVYEQNKALYEEDDEAFYRLILKEPDAMEQFFYYYTRFACETYDKYKEAGISEDIYWATFEDICIWVKHCKGENGVYGIATYDWFWRLFRLKVFRFGRLQFEEDENCIWVHIPQGGPLIWSQCKESIETAYQWFGKGKEYICHSWLLNPALKEVLPEGSNILEFQKHFNVIRIDYKEREAEWRVFGPVLRVVADYPENTTLQRNIKEYLLSGKVLGNGWGVLLDE